MSEQPDGKQTKTAKSLGGRPRTVTPERVIDLYESFSHDTELLTVVAAGLGVESTPRAATIRALAPKPAGQRPADVLTQVAAILQTIADHEIKASMQIMGYEQSERLAIWKFLTALGWADGKLPGDSMTASLQIFETLRHHADDRGRIIRAVEQLSR